MKRKLKAGDVVFIKKPIRVTRFFNIEGLGEVCAFGDAVSDDFDDFDVAVRYITEFMGEVTLYFKREELYYMGFKIGRFKELSSHHTCKE